MLIFNNLEEMKSYYIKEINAYVFKEAITINFTLDVEANITALDINARNINTLDINARNINAVNINAWDITAKDITARDINTGDINAVNINALDINALDIVARDIDARDIKYWAICIARKSFKCKSVKGRRTNSIHKCLDREIKFVKDKEREE